MANESPKAQLVGSETTNAVISTPYQHWVYQAATPHSHCQQVEPPSPRLRQAGDNAFHLHASICSGLSGYFAARIKLLCLLEMFFGQVSHSQIMKAASRAPNGRAHCLE